MLTGRKEILKGAQHLRQLLRRQLGGSARAGAAEACQSYDFVARRHNFSRNPSGGEMVGCGTLRSPAIWDMRVFQGIFHETVERAGDGLGLA